MFLEYHIQYTNRSFNDCIQITLCDSELIQYRKTYKDNNVLQNIHFKLNTVNVNYTITRVFHLFDKTWKWVYIYFIILWGWPTFYKVRNTVWKTN